jgi:hypothetical protein
MRILLLLLLIIILLLVLRGTGSGRRWHGATKTAMTPDEAYEILGLKPGASRTDIIAAHKRLLQRVHPDRGGSDYLAVRINLAKATLLKR